MRFELQAAIKELLANLIFRLAESKSKTGKTPIKEIPVFEGGRVLASSKDLKDALYQRE